MGFVAGASGWVFDAPADWERTRASGLFRPVGMASQLPAGFVTVGAFSAAAQTYTNLNRILWNTTVDGKSIFNIQGQRWTAVDGTPANGCRNAATGRTASGVPVNNGHDFEFLHTGGNLDIELIGSTYYDCQVYIECFGRMYKATAAPVVGTTTGTMHLPISLGATFHGRVRIHLNGAILVGIKTEQSAIVKPSVDRHFAILTGGRWADGKGLKQGSGTSYLTARVCDYLFEKTGIVFAPRAQDSGYFYNGVNTVTDDTAASDGTTRLFSASRKLVLQDDFLEKPLFLVIMGTLDDGGRSGATGLNTGPMYTRAKACYDWVRTKDKRSTLVQISPPPFIGAGGAGTLTGPPTADSSNDFNRREQELAIATISNAANINIFGPSSPAWNATQQVPFIGADGANPNAAGNAFLAARIANELGKLLVDTMRSRRLR